MGNRMQYKIKDGQIIFGETLIDIEDATIRLNQLTEMFEEFRKMFNKHDIKSLSSNLRFLADYFDEDDEKNGCENKEVQAALHKTANILNAVSQRVEGNDGKKV